MRSMVEGADAALFSNTGAHSPSSSALRAATPPASQGEINVTPRPQVREDLQPFPSTIRPMNEFDFIREVLAPLAGEGTHRTKFGQSFGQSFGLTDDAALLRAGAAGLIVTADMLVEGVHFTQDCPPETVAKKSLRVNLSDLAAKGAKPVCYMLCVAWRAERGLDWKRAFVRGLKEDQERYGVMLLGGDTTVTQGPFTVSITAFGEAGPRGMVRRDGAQPGDALYVTGTVGDAGLGLRALQGEGFPGEDAVALVGAYRLPEPPVAFASDVAEHASAAIDVSDGVLADAAHIAAASGARIEIALEHLPLSDAAARWAAAQADRDAALTTLAASGDDYQILFTAPEAAEAALRDAAAAPGLRLTRIGRVLEGGVPEDGPLRVLGASGEIRPGALGFTHF